MRFGGKYGFDGGVFLHRKRLGAEPRLGAWYRFIRLGRDNMGLVDGGDLDKALVAGVSQRTQVKSSSHSCPPYLPSLNLYLSSHPLQQNLTRCQPSAVELWVLL